MSVQVNPKLCFGRGCDAQHENATRDVGVSQVEVLAEAPSDVAALRCCDGLDAHSEQPPESTCRLARDWQGERKNQRAAPKSGPESGISWQPQRDSNPCRHLERVVS